MKSINQVVPSRSRWSVKKTGASKASKTFDTKVEAVEYGRELSRKAKTDLYIHKKNGMVEAKESY